MGVDDVVKEAVPLIFDFDFPIFDKEYKPILCGKILKHYYTREIGEETYGLWKLRLNTKLNEIMPYYNRLYTSGLVTFNPLWDTDLETVQRGKRDGHSEDTELTSEDVDRYSSSSYEGEEKMHQDSGYSNQGTQIDKHTGTHLMNDTPQGDMNGVINLNYMTQANIDTTTDNVQKQDEGTTGTDQESTSSQGGSENVEEKRKIDRNKAGSSTDTSEYITRVTGRQHGNLAQQLEGLKSTLLNIDMMVINDLECLFMTIF